MSFSLKIEKESFANVFRDNRNPITAARFPSRKLDNTRIQGIRVAGNVSACMSFLSDSIFIRRVAGQGVSRRNPCPEWSREVSAAWSRVGFSTSRPYILIIIIGVLLMRTPERT